MNIFGRKRSVIPKSASFTLTERGRDKLQEFNGDDRTRVLAALETKGTCDTSEIANEAQLSVGKIERMMPVLIRGGYVQYNSASSLGDLD